MSPPTWDEYFAAATAHLEAARVLSEQGAPPPPPPERPLGAMPQGHRARARALALGYDQLALELITRMVAITQYRSVSRMTSPHRESGRARYLDALL